MPRPSSVKGGYVREALGRGLEIEQRVGVNPFEFGLIGSSDVHTGLVNSDEKLAPANLDTPARRAKVCWKRTRSFHGVNGSTAGLAGVWAESNTRESIYDALYRRETFATSGTRLRVRLFAGFDYPQGLTKQRDWVKRGLCVRRRHGQRSVGRQGERQAASHPGAGSQRSGRRQSRSHPDRQGVARRRQGQGTQSSTWRGPAIASPTPRAACLPIGSIGRTWRQATYTNDIGANELIAEWQDPTFRADQTAVYYARVLEIPTPRWSTYLAVQNKLPIPTSVPSDHPGARLDFSRLSTGPEASRMKTATLMHSQQSCAASPSILRGARRRRAVVAPRTRRKPRRGAAGRSGSAAARRRTGHRHGHGAPPRGECAGRAHSDRGPRRQVAGAVSASSASKI